MGWTMGVQFPAGERRNFFLFTTIPITAGLIFPTIILALFYISYCR
jgi:hypothetical protein